MNLYDMTLACPSHQLEAGLSTVSFPLFPPLGHLSACLLSGAV